MTFLFLIGAAHGLHAQTVSPSVGAEFVPTVRARCEVIRKDHLSELPSFTLFLSPKEAEIEINENGRDSAYIGHLKQKPKLEESVDNVTHQPMVYVGFDSLVKDYEVSLSVPASVLSSSHEPASFSVKFYARGDALLQEDYGCLVDQ